MAFEGLSDKLNNVFKKLKSRGKLSEADVKEAMREVRLALLCREYGDEENDVFTLYKYDGTATDKIKVSKAKALKELIALERSSVVILLDQIKMSA